MGRLVDDVLDFCATHEMAHSTFGRMACKDPRLVTDLTNGRTPNSILEHRIRTAMREHEADLRKKGKPTDDA